MYLAENKEYTVNSQNRSSQHPVLVHILYSNNTDAMFTIERAISFREVNHPLFFVL